MTDDCKAVSLGPDPKQGVCGFRHGNQVLTMRTSKGPVKLPLHHWAPVLQNSQQHARAPSPDR